MGPDLWELFEDGGTDDEVAAIIRLGRSQALPQGVRAVSQFGDIVTVRLTRSQLPKVSGAAEVADMSAGGALLGPDLELESVGLPELSSDTILPTDERRPSEEVATGRGVVVGVVDWGFDFAHPDFRNPDGSTRILALWDQRGGKRPDSPKPFGYGVVHDRESINRALQEKDPYAALHYHPADADTGIGCHGTHVASIAAGSGGENRPAGIAPQAELIFVHNAPWDDSQSGRLGDSVTVLEGVDFIVGLAGDRSLAINLSMGCHADQHDGSTHVERGLDAAVRAAAGRAICLSAGNYFNKRIHASGQLRPTQERRFAWSVNENKPSDYNQLQVWYSGQDQFEAVLRSPDGKTTAQAKLGERAKLMSGGVELGNIYHRPQEPNTLDNHINIFLYKEAPAGEWTVTLVGSDVIDGRFHAWIEREVGCPPCQSRFAAEDADSRSTTGTICNGRRTFAVGAYNNHDPEQKIGPFSSVGPTRDGRLKPDLCAPGVQVLAARSAPRKAGDTALPLTRMSGTSMAAPHVTGTVALMFEAAPRKLRIEETHNILLENARRVSVPEENPDRVGIGFLDVQRAVEAARSVAAAGRPFKQITVRLAPASPPKASAKKWVNATAPVARAPAQIVSEAAEASTPESISLAASEIASLPSVSLEQTGTASALGPCPDIVTVHRRLARGSVDPAVREAQRKLNIFHLTEIAAGRAGAPLVADCIFGPRTFDAVKAFQQRMFPGQPKEHDGIIGQKTWAQLDLVPAMPPFPPPPPRPSPDPVLAFDTSPEHWFLTRAEIAAARGNAESRPGLGEFTSQNLAQPLIDGEEMMRALHGDLVSVGPGDFAHFTAWRLNISQDLTPGSTPSPASSSRFDNLVKAVAARGGRARALIWQAGSAGFTAPSFVPTSPIVPASTIRAHVRENTQARDWFNTVGGKGVIDARFPAFGSHHQKSAILMRTGEAVAYCGGIDVCPDRWDTQRHDNDAHRTRESFAGWHDVHLRLRGPAVLEIEQNFRERWNAKEQPCFRCFPFEPVPPPITDPLPPVATAPGTHHVQVLRTYACAHDHYHEFAPRGETTVFAGYLKAIRAARNYIYIEDQYLVSEELALALASALDTAQKLIILVPPETDAPLPEAFNFHQAKFLRIVSARHPEKVSVYHPVQPATGAPIYVHSKVMIIDDVYAVIGSPNVNRRGMTHDTELAAAVVDADLVDGVCRYARDLRRRLWGEHLNVLPNDPVIADPILAVAEWERQAAAGTFRVRRHVTPKPQVEQPRRWNGVADPDGRCSVTVAPGTILAMAPGTTQSAVEVVEAAELVGADAETSFLEVAEHVVATHRANQTHAPIWTDMLKVSGFGESLGDPATGRLPSAAETFDALAHPCHATLRAQLEDHFEVVAAPGSAPASSLRTGDVVIRRSEGNQAHVAVLGGSELREREALRAEGLQVEAALGGHYARVIEGGSVPHTLNDGFARRITGGSGCMPPNQMVLRARGAPASPERIDPLSLVVGVGLASALSRPAPAPTARAADPDRTDTPGGVATVFEGAGEGTGDRCPPDRPDTIAGFPRHSSSVADLPQAERDKLAELARTLANSPEHNKDNPFDKNPAVIAAVKIIGFADSDPEAERREPGFLERISEQRADAVCRDLISRLSPDRAKGFEWIRIGRGAQERAVADARNERERQCNRRVTVTSINASPPALSADELIAVDVEQELFRTFYHAALQATSGLHDRQPRLAESKAREIAESTVQAYRARVLEFLAPHLAVSVPLPFVADALQGTASKPDTASEVANHAIDIAKVAHVGPFLEFRRLLWKHAKLPQPRSADCEIERGKIAGPANHVLCATHGHIIDTAARMVIAHSVEEYKSGKFPASTANSDGGEAVTVVEAALSEATAGEWREQAPVATVGPFADQAYGPQMIRDPQRTQDLINAIAAVKATLSARDQRRLDQVAFAIAKLGTGNNPMEYAGLRDSDMLFTASLAKMALLPASFELLFRVQQLAPGTAAADPKQFFAAVHKAFNATIRRAIAWIPPGDWRETKIEEVLTATLNASGGFNIAMSAGHRSDLEGVFSDQNNNVHARRCIHRLGYSYVDGAMAAGGFLGTESSLDTFKKGIWMANDIGGGWPQFFVPVQTRGKSSMAATAVDLANVLTAMHRGTLIDSNTSREMMNILSRGGSWLQMVPNSVRLGIISRGAKVGHASSDDAHVPTVKSEAAFLDRGGVLFAAVWQNYPDASPVNPADVSIVYRVIDEVTRLWP